MNYQLELHPDVARRLQALTRVPRETVTAALGDLARDCTGTTGEDNSLVATWVTGPAGERFRVQFTCDHDGHTMRVLSLRQDTRHT